MEAGAPGPFGERAVAGPVPAAVGDAAGLDGCAAQRGQVTGRPAAILVQWERRGRVRGRGVWSVCVVAWLPERVAATNKGP